MAWVDLMQGILTEFEEAQRMVDQWAGTIDRWIWWREKRRAKDRKTSLRPERKAYKLAKAKEYKKEEIRKRYLLGERPKRLGRIWKEVAMELSNVA